MLKAKVKAPVPIHTHLNIASNPSEKHSSSAGSLFVNDSGILSKGGPELGVGRIPAPLFSLVMKRAGRQTATPTSRPPGSGSKNRKVSLLPVTGISCGPKVISPERGKALGARGGGKDYCSPRWATASASCAGSSAGAAAESGSTPSFLPSLCQTLLGNLGSASSQGQHWGALREPYQGRRDRLESALGALQEPHRGCRDRLGSAIETLGEPRMGAETGWGQQRRPWESLTVGAETNRPLTAFLGKAEALKDVGLNLASVHFLLWTLRSSNPLQLPLQGSASSTMKLRCRRCTHF